MIARWAAVAILILAAAAQEDRAPVQPIPFSHKQHAGALKLQCKMCHPNPDPGETMTIAKPAVCMSCHSAIKTDSPAIQRIAQADQSGTPIRWARVYAIPAFVYFSHRTHTEKGNTCQDCHGPVAERDRLWREGDISMGGCMECHRVKKASMDCGYCHEPR
jgi:hypothetical protein